MAPGILLVVGCAPTLPFHATETADVLARGQVAVSIAGGGGDGTRTNGNSNLQPVSGCCGGAAARVRVGVGHDQEVGGEMSSVVYLEDPGSGQPKSGAVYLAGKVRYKLGLGPRWAFVAGVGGSGGVGLEGSGSSPFYAGADVGILASTRPFQDRLQIYGGLRFTVALPATAEFYHNVPTELFTVPLGVAVRVSPRWQLFFEGGLLGAVSETRDERAGNLETIGWIAGYAAAAVQYTVGPL